jgi:hypothetical protein
VGSIVVPRGERFVCIRGIFILNEMCSKDKIYILVGI